MIKIRVPIKPFPEYKWRWAVVTPTESLNKPTVFFGVLRAMRSNEGSPPSSDAFIATLQDVQSETKAGVNLARTKERNLIRNSGQYWKALDLLKESRGEIALTNFGRKVADGLITKAEFASTIVKTLETPNPHIEEDISGWQRAGLKIKPLELILHILVKLKDENGLDQSYITPNELIKIVIPLAGENAGLDEHVAALISYRKGILDISQWPDCAPRANDKRMAREFLLFLLYYGLCSYKRGKDRFNDKYILSEIEIPKIEELVTLSIANDKPETAVKDIRKIRMLNEKERKRIMREILTRPNQPIFRNNVLARYKSKCLVTGVNLEPVLEAAHIIPVGLNGKDTIDNGICLRSDIHILFDSGHLRIDTSGNIHLSEDSAHNRNYGKLKRKVSLPSFVRMEYVAWRWKYL